MCQFRQESRRNDSLLSASARTQGWNARRVSALRWCRPGVPLAIALTLAFGWNGLTTRVYTSTQSAPAVSTPTSSSITARQALLGGTVDSDGGGTITGRGVVYSPTSLNSDPVIGGANVVRVQTTGTTGTFAALSTGLAPNTA